MPYPSAMQYQVSQPQPIPATTASFQKSYYSVQYQQGAFLDPYNPAYGASQPHSYPSASYSPTYHQSPPSAGPGQVSQFPQRTQYTMPSAYYVPQYSLQ